jgi:hypothetical protein
VANPPLSFAADLLDIAALPRLVDSVYSASAGSTRW